MPPVLQAAATSAKGIFAMRALMLMMAALGAGCAGQPANTQAQPSAAAPLALNDAGRLAIAKNLNLKVVDKDGQQLFCRSNFMTGSHIQRDTTCYTADELERLEAQQQRDLDQLALRSSAGGIRTP
jgi:hypothetical protein